MIDRQELVDNDVRRRQRRVDQRNAKSNKLVGCRGIAVADETSLDRVGIDLD